MNNSFEGICDAECKRGWFPSLHRTPTGWTCRLECGVDVMPANEPRPFGSGPTAEAALTDAVRRRQVAMAA